MLKIKPVALALIGVFGASTMTTAIAGNNDQLQQKIDQITKQQQQLQQQVSELKSQLRNQTLSRQQKLLMNKDTEQAVHAYSFVRLGSYLAQQFKFDGSELVINAPSVLESLDLLQQRRDQNMKSKANGYPQEVDPYMVLSGVVEGQAGYKDTSTPGSVDSSDIDLTDAEIAMQLVMNKWVNGLLTVSYNNDLERGSALDHNINGFNRVTQSNVYVNKAFVTIGNLMEAPVYGSIGQMYVPFGRYSSGMVSHAITRDLGRTKARAIDLGYYQTNKNGFQANGYIFNAADGTAQQQNKIANFGADFAYHFDVDSISGEAGVGYISNIADSDGLSDNGYAEPCGPNSVGPSCKFSGFSWKGTPLHKKVGGYDIHAKASFGKFSALAEYVTAAQKFDPRDLYFDDGSGVKNGAKPSALDVQGAYSFMAGNLASSVVLEYAMSRQALGIQVPKQRYGAALNFDVWKDTIFSLEYRHDKLYGASTRSGQSGNAGEALAGQGDSDNVVTAQLDMYF